MGRGLRGADDPIGPKGAPIEFPFTQYLSFGIVQVTREDLAKWLAATVEDPRKSGNEVASSDTLIVDWKDGSSDILTTRSNGSVVDLPLRIAQVEEVKSVTYDISYVDDSKLAFELNIGNVSLRYSAKQPNSFAQHAIFAVRNLIQTSNATRQPAVGRRGAITAGMGVLYIIIAYLVVYAAQLLGVVAGLALVALIGAVFFRISLKLNESVLTASRADPLAIAYPVHRWTRGQIFGVIVGCFGIVGAIAAVIVIFYSPN